MAALTIRNTRAALARDRIELPVSSASLGSRRL